MKINFIIIFIFISLINILSTTTTYSIYPTHLKKNKRLTIRTDDEVVIFESQSFQEGEEILFKITSSKFKSKDIKFEFLDIINANTLVLDNKASPDKKKDAEDVYTSKQWKTSGITYFYTIKKDKNYLKDNIKGNYLAIYLENSGFEVMIENYKKTEVTTTAIIIVVIIIVVIIACFAFWCYKRRKGQAISDDIEVYEGNNVNVNNFPNQSNYGNQQYSQSYNNNKNMNMNMNMNQKRKGNKGNNNNGYNNNNAYNNNNGYSNNNNAYNNNNALNNNNGYSNNNGYNNVNTYNNKNALNNNIALNNNNAYNSNNGYNSNNNMGYSNNNQYNIDAPYSSNLQQYNDLPQNSNTMRNG